MKIFRINQQIEIECETKKTRNGFKHEATLFMDGREYETVKICYLNRTWERYTYQSVLGKLIDKTIYLSENQKEECRKYIEQYEEGRSETKMIGIIAQMGEIFEKTTERKNKWKKNMLQAGFGKAIDFPEDFDGLSEKEKERRLNGAINILTQ